MLRDSIELNKIRKWYQCVCSADGMSQIVRLAKVEMRDSFERMLQVLRIKRQTLAIKATPAIKPAIKATPAIKTTPAIKASVKRRKTTTPAADQVRQQPRRRGRELRTLTNKPNYADEYVDDPEDEYVDAPEDEYVDAPEDEYVDDPEIVDAKVCVINSRHNGRHPVGRAPFIVVGAVGGMHPHAPFGESLGLLI
jgi:hypothetical protein